MGKGVRIAIIDSGVDANHPDIAPTWPSTQAK
jgi:subtilisin family serine protease